MIIKRVFTTTIPIWVPLPQSTFLWHQTSITRIQNAVHHACTQRTIGLVKCQSNLAPTSTSQWRNFLSCEFVCSRKLKASPYDYPTQSPRVFTLAVANTTDRRDSNANVQRGRSSTLLRSQSTTEVRKVERAAEKRRARLFFHIVADGEVLWRSPLQTSSEANPWTVRGAVKTFGWNVFAVVCVAQIYRTNAVASWLWARAKRLASKFLTIVWIVSDVDRDCIAVHLKIKRTYHNGLTLGESKS